MKAQSRQREITGRHVAGIMVAFFAVIIAVNFTMAGLANGSWTGLVVKNSYVASQNFNDELEKARRQSALGWTSQLIVEEDRIVIHLADAEGTPALLTDAIIAIGRPTHEQMDRTVDAVHQGAGIYVAPSKLAPGLWEARFEGRARDMTFRRHFRFTVPATRLRP